MKNWRKARRLSFSIPLMLLVMAAMSIGPATTALAQGMASGAQAGTRQAPPPIEPFSEVSDPRAEHLDHTNVTTCTGAAPGGLGLPAGTIQVGTSPKSNTSGTVTSGPITYRIYTNNLNTSTWSTNTAALIDITVAPGTTVLAVAVKGGDGTNVYTPPNVPPGQTVAFRSPLNNGGRLPTISHWIVCYSFTPPPPPDDDGSITVTKVVKGPGGVPVTALPSSYSATVACTGHSPQTVTAPESGGRFDPNPLVFTPPTTCTVTETTIDPRATVTYSVDGGPPSSSPPSVPIQSGTPHLVTITNDFSNAPILMGELHLQKVVTNPGDATLPQDWTAQVHCDLAAGDLTETVTMPSDGGPGDKVVHPNVGGGCSVEEFDVPAGWTVTYSVNGGPTQSAPPFIDFESSEPVTVTITNTGPKPTPTPTVCPSASPSPSPAPGPSPCGPGLPSTGGPPTGGSGLPLFAALMACLTAAAGAGVTIRTVRR